MLVARRLSREAMREAGVAAEAICSRRCSEGAAVAEVDDQKGLTCEYELGTIIALRLIAST